MRGVERWGMLSVCLIDVSYCVQWVMGTVVCDSCCVQRGMGIVIGDYHCVQWGMMNVICDF